MYASCPVHIYSYQCSVQTPGIYQEFCHEGLNYGCQWGCGFCKYFGPRLGEPCGGPFISDGPSLKVGKLLSKRVTGTFVRTHTHPCNLFEIVKIKVINH